MSKADHGLTMSGAPSPTRRALFVTGVPAVLTAAGIGASVLGTHALAEQVQSPEFAFYLRQRQEFDAWFDKDPEPPRPAWDSPAFKTWDSSEHDAWEDRETAIVNALHTAVATVLDREPQTWRDVVELAQVVHTQLWEGLEQVSECDQLETALMVAILKMGGVHVG